MDAYKTELIKQIANFSGLQNDFRNELIEKISQNKSVNFPTNSFIHVTASSFLVDYQREKLLLVFNDKYNRWLQPGGHCLPNELPKEAAYRELTEETQVEGITDKYFLENAVLFDISLHDVSAEKEEIHQHIDFRYLLQNKVLKVNSESSEVSSVSWISLNSILNNPSFNCLKQVFLLAEVYLKKNT